MIMNYYDADNDHMEFDYLRQELFRSSCAIIRTCALTRTAYILFFQLSPSKKPQCLNSCYGSPLEYHKNSMQLFCVSERSHVPRYPCLPQQIHLDEVQMSVAPVISTFSDTIPITYQRLQIMKRNTKALTYMLHRNTSTNFKHSLDTFHPII